MLNTASWSWSKIAAFLCFAVAGAILIVSSMTALVGLIVYVKLRDREEPISTLFYLPPNPNVHYSAVLMSKRK